MAFKLTIDTDNAAFDEDGGHPAPREQEVARILRAIADDLATGTDDFAMYRTLRDINGNDVGRAAFKDNEPATS